VRKKVNYIFCKIDSRYYFLCYRLVIEFQEHTKVWNN